jgi:hypothetical protein
MATTQGGNVSSITPQAQHVLATQDWDEGLGWNVNVEALPEIIALFKTKVEQMTKTIEAFNASCVYDANAPEDVIDGFETMSQRDYFNLYFGPKAPGRAWDEAKS